MCISPVNNLGIRVSSTHMCQVTTLQCILSLDGSSVISQSQLNNVIVLGNMPSPAIAIIELMGRMILKKGNQTHCCCTLTCCRASVGNIQVVSTFAPFLKVKEGDLYITDITFKRLLTTNVIFRRLM